MSTYKRRIVYLTDDQWLYIRTRAEEHDQTASAWLRGVLESDGRVVPTAAERDHEAAEYRRIDQERFNTRPFTPVPKVKK